MTSRSVFVTGAFGLLGSWLVKELVERGERVTVLRRDKTARSLFATLGLESEVTIVEGDVCDAPLIERTIGEYEVDTVFHLAAQTLVPTANRSPAATFDVNIRGTWTVMEAVRSHQVPRTVVASSDKAYGPHDDLPYREDFALQPRHPYDASKAAADMVARSYWHTFGVPVAVTRFANLYGGGDLNYSRLVPEVVRAVLLGRPPVIRSDGSPQRDFLFVEDAVAAYLAIADALDGPACGQAYNAGSGKPVAIGEVVHTICRLAGAGATPEILGKGSPKGEIPRQFVDGGKLRRELGWSPAVGLEEGLARTLDWYGSHRELLDA